MNCYELFDLSWRAMHRKEGQALQARFHGKSPWSSSGVGIFPEGIGQQPEEIGTRIEEYTLSRLSYPSDRLNASLGILEMFEAACAAYLGMRYPPGN